MTIADLVGRFVTVAIVAIGGANATIAPIHAQFVGRGVLDEATFDQLVAVAQITPGPNMMIVPLIGFHVAGVAGAIAATLAFILPTTPFAVAADRALRRGASHPVVTRLQRILRPIAAGLLAATGIVLVRGTGFDVAGVAVGLAAFTVTAATEFNPLWVVIAAAAVGFAIA